SYGACQLCQRHRRLEVRFHVGNYGKQLRVADARAVLDRHSLRVVRLAHEVVQHLLGDTDGELVAEVPRDRMDHHVERRRTTGTGVAITVDLEQRRSDVQVRKVLYEPLHVLPVNGASIAGKKAGTREREGSGADSAQSNAAPGEFPQATEHGLVSEPFCTNAGADKNGPRIQLVVKGAVG